MLKVKLLTSTAKLPQRAHKGDLYDVFANEDMEVGAVPVLVGTGIALDIPEGYHVKLYNRSSNPLKKGLILANSVGIIDTNYKDELKCIFYCIPHAIGAGEVSITHQIKKGDKIAQIEMIPIHDFEIEQVEELDKTNDRGGGFGSTGN